MTENENLPEDLEKMISEAEMEAQIEGEQAEITEVEPAEEEAAEKVEEVSQEKGLSPGRKIFRRILVWLVVLAIAFAGGFFVDTFLRLQPERARVESLTADLDESSQAISALESEIQRLSAFEEQNADLMSELDLATTHLTLLSARANVAETRLALAQDRLADARLALDKLGSTLETLKTLVNPDQADVVENMIQRQQLIVIELDDDGFSAQTDLEVLAARLSALENTLFATP